MKKIMAVLLVLVCTVMVGCGGKSDESVVKEKANAYIERMTEMMNGVMISEDDFHNEFFNGNKNGAGTSQWQYLTQIGMSAKKMGVSIKTKVNDIDIKKVGDNDKAVGYHATVHMTISDSDGNSQEGQVDIVLVKVKETGIWHIQEVVY